MENFFRIVKNSILLFPFILYYSLNGQENHGISNDLTQARYFFDLANKASEESLDSCIIYSKMALAYVSNSTKDDFYFKVTNSLIGCLYLNEDYFDAKRFSEVAANQVLRSNSVNVSTKIETINNIAVLNSIFGNHREAISWHNQNHQILMHEKFKSEYFFDALINMATAYFELGDFSMSLNFADYSLDQLQKEKKIAGFEWKRVQYLLGKVYSALGEKKQAIKCLKECLDSIDESDMKSTMLKLNSLKLISEEFLSIGDKKAAKKYIDEILIQSKELSIFESEVASLFGKYYELLNDYDKAVFFHKKALKLRLKKYSGYQRHKSFSKPIFDISKIFYDSNKLDSSLFYANKGINNLELPNSGTEGTGFQDNIEAIKFLEIKSLLYLKRYEKSANLEFLKESLFSLEKIIICFQDLHLNLFEKESKYFLSEKLHPIFELAIENCFRLKNLSKPNPWLNKAFKFSENFKSLCLNEELDLMKSFSPSGERDNLTILENNLQIEIAFLQKKIFDELNKKKPNQKNVEKWKKSFFEKKQNHSMLASQLKSNIELNSKKNFDFNGNYLFNWEKDQNELFLEYFWGNRNIYIFSFFNGKESFFRVPINDSLVNTVKLVKNVWAKSSEGDYEQFLNLKKEDLYFLYIKLLYPILSDIISIPKRVIIVPDNELSFLPFEIFITNPKISDSYVFREFPINYQYSFTIRNKLVEKIDKKSFNYTFFGISPTFPVRTTDLIRDCSPTNLGYLSCNKKEITDILEITGLKEGVLLANTKAAFQLHAPHARIIHLATHACNNLGDPELSRIYFEDGDLTQNQLGALSLQADMVVLSACNTASGKLQPGEGILSLAKSFFRANCRSLLTSLWSLDDCVTPEILKRYYGHLKTGKEKDVALQQAKLDYLENARGLRAHPFFWGPLVQYGNIEPIELDDSGSWSAWWVWGLLVAVPGVLLWRRQSRVNRAA